MSHSVVVTLQLTNKEKNDLCLTCDECVEQLENALKNFRTALTHDAHVINYLNKQIADIKKTKENIQTENTVRIDDNNLRIIESELFFQREQQKVMKKVQNILESIGNGSQFETLLKHNEDLISLVLEYGITFWEPSEQIGISDFSKINIGQLTNKIDELINKETSSKRFENYKKDLMEILERDFPNNEKLKEELFLKGLNYKTNAELNDYLLYVKNKKFNIVAMNKIINTIAEELKKSYRYQMTKKVHKIDQETGMIKYIFSFRNHLGESFDIDINEELRMSFKYGDYKSHCCEATTQKIFEALENNKFIQRGKPQIVRNVTDAKPLYKSIDKYKRKGE